MRQTTLNRAPMSIEVVG